MVYGLWSSHSPYLSPVFYGLLKLYARLAIRIYCKKIIIDKPSLLKQDGPLLLACNHPNSFLDGMILTTLFDHPVHSLARGDAFKKRWMDRFLRSLQLLPVYRTSEGVENLEHNYTTFASCIEAFKENGIVLIFSEGRCENEWHLRPLKKGTARLAIAAWKENIPLTVVPTALNYSSFRKFGKEVHLYFGDPIRKDGVIGEDSEGKQLLAFNQQLYDQLKKMVYEIKPDEKQKRRKLFGIRLQPIAWLLALPAIAGWLLHAPLFYPVKIFAELRFRNSGHYDSVLTSLLLILYPLYLVLLAFLAYTIDARLIIAALFIAPLTAWCCVQAKYGADL